MLLPWSQTKSNLRKSNEQKQFKNFSIFSESRDQLTSRIIHSIYSLIFTTVVGDDKLGIIILENILSRRSWKAELCIYIVANLLLL